MSRPFELPATRQGDETRFSAYVRLVAASPASPWELGLVRVETWDPALLEAAAAICLANAQDPTSADRR